MKKERILLKTLIASSFIHIAGISLFGIVLPQSYTERKPIEVSLLPSYTAPEDIKLAKIEIIPDIPQVGTSYEKLAMSMEKTTVKFSTEKFTGSSEYLPIASISPRFEFPERSVSFPAVAEPVYEEQLTAGRMETLEIEGLAGNRQLVYRKPIDYPVWAQRQGMEGNIKIRFNVNYEGKITSTAINYSSGYPELDIYAEENFRKWLFESAKTDKEIWGVITFRFRLK
ncbi:MAG TPA: energy transducer TonB [bacterium]|nr:energy transducer TonB [bacterium]